FVDVGTVRGTIEADLAQRDFTIDAMAAAIEEGGRLGALVDPYGGEHDLRAKEIRLVAERALTEDPLRLLRAVRIATEMGLEIVGQTSIGIRRKAPMLATVAPERQRDELLRILESDHSARAIRLIESLGLLEVLLPEIALERGVDQPKEHYYDVYNHTI